MLDDEDFLAGRIDTSFIDRKLADRNGAPFQAPSAETLDLAAVAAALHTELTAGGAGGGEAGRCRLLDSPGAAPRA